MTRQRVLDSPQAAGHQAPASTASVRGEAPSGFAGGGGRREPPMDNALPQDGTRRAFLKRGIALFGGFVAVGLSAVGGGYFLSPLWGREEHEWVELTDVDALPIGEPVNVEFVQRRRDGWVTTEGRASAWVVSPDGKQFSVFDPRCTHLGCPFRWDGDKQQFRCPCHNAAFAIDGAVLAGPPPRPLDQFPSKVVGGKLMIQPMAQHEEKA